MHYVNCKDRFGQYLVVECRTDKEAKETEALLNAQYSPERVFWCSKYSAGPLTPEMMANPQDIKLERWHVQEYDPKLGTYVDSCSNLMDLDSALRIMKKSKSGKKVRVAHVIDTLIGETRVKREYLKVHLPDDV